MQRNLRCRKYLQRIYCLCMSVAELSATHYCLCTSVADISATHYCLCTSVADISATLYCLCTSVADCIFNKIFFFCNAFTFVADIFCNALCVAVFHHIVGISYYTTTPYALQISATQR